MRLSAVRTYAVLAVLSLSAVDVTAQAPAGQKPAPPPAQDFSKVDIKTTKLAGNFYTVVGAGGTIGALVGPDGVFLVDAQFAPLTDKIVAAIRQISDRPIRFLVNTHQHGDHTGGNENFAKMGVTLIARDELRAGLAKMPTTPPGGLPLITYRGSTIFHMNGEDVQLIPVPAAHTSGDTMVRFPTADVIMTGDFYRSLGYPNIDRPNGGTAKGMLDGFNAIIQLAGPNTKIVPGHGEVVDKAAVTAHRDMMMVVRDRVEALVKQGKTLADIMAAKPTSDYDSKVPQGPMTIERFVTQLYGELGGT